MESGGKEMKTTKILSIGLLSIILVAVPVAAGANGGYGGAAFLGFGLGLLTGLTFAPWPVYAAPSVYYAPPPPAVYRYYPSYVPEPVPPSSYGGYSDRAKATSVSPPPAGRCREWRLIDRHWEDRWNSQYGRSQKILVERFGWVGTPCGH
jgi:hypothetical protein